MKINLWISIEWRQQNIFLIFVRWQHFRVCFYWISIPFFFSCLVAFPQTQTLSGYSFEFQNSVFKWMVWVPGCLFHLTNSILSKNKIEKYPYQKFIQFSYTVIKLLENSYPSSILKHLNVFCEFLKKILTLRMHFSQN